MCILDQYQIVFKNSNVVEEMETLDILSAKLNKRKPSIIINKGRALLASILDSYTYLISVYKTLAHIQMLSPNFKRYDMVKYQHDWCKASAGSDVKVLVAEVVKELIDPKKHPKISPDHNKLSC
ncbi:MULTISPECIES: hypothetical protein [unclassified Mucilaginibacter]|uniref:hypothetical protein n=1 Tax=unclassified Mucilaginibacter TaxID=2617802 RepID=UPI002AC9B7B9|nr:MULTISPECIES: hypothetical protein [unclassified Mucilaginibacter]MEB0263905.1 hypothetical protein [Mucilaginibacter sp. 10I4]MEB0279315.1 hypothetical protein [Mucilaginibacter sp. 10B2]MEB0302900.1 hypothetical protein [Mucilaginibacter sp. 5C4]WPX23173.1 hypothetical protein RHM67_17985 [Mucilaginibacter sp. 5C4]